MEEHLDLCLGDHLVHKVLRALGVERRLPVVLVGEVASGYALLEAAIHELLRKPLGDELPLAVFLDARRHQEQHEPVGEKPAQRTIALDERDLRARARRGNCRAEASRTAAYDHHVGFVENRHLAHRAIHLAVLQERARPVSHRVRNVEDALDAPVVFIADEEALRRSRVGRNLVAERDTGDAGSADEPEFLQELTFGDLHG